MGDKIIGEYSIGKIVGVYENGILKGEFKDSEIAPEGGLFELVFEDDNSAFKGKWKTGLDIGKMTGSWNGKRI